MSFFYLFVLLGFLGFFIDDIIKCKNHTWKRKISASLPGSLNKNNCKTVCQKKETQMSLDILIWNLKSYIGSLAETIVFWMWKLKCRRSYQKYLNLKYICNMKSETYILKNQINTLIKKTSYVLIVYLWNPPLSTTYCLRWQAFAKLNLFASIKEK